MAAASHLTANIYGTLQGSPPYDGTSLTQPNFWATPVRMSFPTTGTVFHPITPGAQVNNTSNYIYSVIEVQASGLNVHSVKYTSNESVATLATDAG